MASLRELQHAFAAALRDPAASCAVRPVANLGIYRNNTAHQFREALGSTFPVVRRRVGDDYFRQLAFHYRAEHPSRSGDLYEVGRAFPTFLTRHHEGSEYAWLADLAWLEWLRVEAAVIDAAPAIGVEALASVPAEELEGLKLVLQPSLRVMESRYPVLAVWEANQGEIAAPVDQSLGNQAVMILSRADGVEMRLVESGLFAFVQGLLQGAALGEAMTRARFDEAGLLRALQLLFGEGLVTGISAGDHSKR